MEARAEEEEKKRGDDLFLALIVWSVDMGDARVVVRSASVWERHHNGDIFNNFICLYILIFNTYCISRNHLY